MTGVHQVGGSNEESPSSQEARQPVLIIRALSRHYEDAHANDTVTAVDKVTLSAKPGEFVCLFGASGSGKSTLLNLVAGLDTPDEGTVWVAGEELTLLSESERARHRLRNVGVVFQDDNLIDEFTAAENVAFPLELQGMDGKAARAQAVEQLKRVGIGELADRAPVAMSGGQRQRVGIARALVGGRSVLLADEPTGALDSKATEAVFELIQTMCGFGALAVVASHDPRCARYASRSVQMVDGRLVS